MIPPSRKEEVKDTIFGTIVRDPYRWLEDGSSSEVKAWMDAQDAHARHELQKLPGRSALTKRFRELFYVDSVSAPWKRGKREFFTRKHSNREKSIVYWKYPQEEKEHVLLDPNTMSTDGSTSLGTWAPSWNGEKVAYTLKKNNADEATLYVRDVESGSDSAVDVIEGARWADPQWTPDQSGFYYTLYPTNPLIPIADRSGYAEIRFHRIGTKPSDDPLIHPKTGDPKSFIAPGLSRDGRWLFAYIYHGWDRNEIFVRDLKSRDPAFKPLFTGSDALASVVVWGDFFYIGTNDKTPRWKIVKAKAGDLDRRHWKTIVPQDKNAVIENFGVIGEKLILTLLLNAHNEIAIHDLGGKYLRKIVLPGTGVSGIGGEPDDDEAYYSFSSFTTPKEIYRTSISSGETSLWTKIKVPVDTSPYTVEQVWYPSKDGTRVSMFIVRREDMEKDGSTPFLMTGYGGFNSSELPQFNSSIFPWLEAGGGYAIPNLRGGGEYGEKWHRAGMLTRKQNVFDDFIYAAKYLIRNQYTRPEKLAISGGSNGGLLVGAALTQRPDLFRAVICEVPLLDMIRYQNFGVAKLWVPEYGSSENEAQFRALYAYSPYHHVNEEKSYPAVLFASADSDDRVDPMHARKMAAALQGVRNNHHPILLRIEKNAGHGGADLTRQWVEKSADNYSFLMSQLKMNFRREKD